MRGAKPWGVAIILEDGKRVVVSTHDALIDASAMRDEYAYLRDSSTFAIVQRFVGYHVGESWFGETTPDGLPIGDDVTIEALASRALAECDSLRRDLVEARAQLETVSRECDAMASRVLELSNKIVRQPPSGSHDASAPVFHGHGYEAHLTAHHADGTTCPGLSCERGLAGRR